jgi:hypothetical protein
MKHSILYATWEQGNSTMELTMHECTIEEATAKAIYLGYKPPVWYKPWTYLTRNLIFYY